MDVEINKLANLDLSGFTVNGKVSIASESTGTISIAEGTINGDLEINTPNATVSNAANVNGETKIISVDTNSFITSGKHVGGILITGKGRIELSNMVETTNVTVDTDENTQGEVILEGKIENIILKKTKNIKINTEIDISTTIKVEEKAVIEGLKIDVPVTIISSDPVKMEVKESVEIRVKSQDEDEDRTVIGSGTEEEIIIKVNMEGLKQAKASAANKGEDDYTLLTWESLQSALRLKENTQADIDTKTQAINNAINSLVEKADLTVYEKALSSVKEEDYTTDSWVIYQEVVEANKVTTEDTKEEVNQAKTNILNAQKNLVFAGWAELDILKTEVGELIEADYTADSWSALQDVLALPETTNVEIIGKVAAITETVGTMNLEKAIIEALGYNYSPKYNYIGEGKYEGFVIKREYEGGWAEHVLNSSNLSNDIARYLGALHYINNGESVVKIIYKDRNYTWIPNTSGTYLKGSNWRENAFTTLISRIVDGANLDMLTEGILVTLEDKGGHKVDLTFKATFSQ